MVKEKNIGSTLESFLKEEGNYEKSQAIAIKRVISWQLQETMKKQHISKSEMARRMNTSRAHLDRLLDPENEKVQLDTLYKAATAVGKQLHLERVHSRFFVKKLIIYAGWVTRQKTEVRSPRKTLISDFDMLFSSY